MTGAELFELWEALPIRARRCAFSWTIYGMPATIPAPWRTETWAEFAGFRAAVARSTTAEVNIFLGMTGSRSRVAA